MNNESKAVRANRLRPATPMLAGIACALVVGTLGAQRIEAPGPLDRGASVTASESGIRVNRRDVLFGNPRRTQRPAEVDLDVCTAATPEGKTIDEEGIPPGSARYNILMAKAHARVRKAVKKAAVAAGRDCVVKKGSIKKNPDNLEVVDLTSDVIAALDS